MSLATAELSLGHRSVMVAGGMESLSNSPFTLARGQTPYGGLSLTDTCNHDGLTDAYTGWHMGKCAEVTQLTILQSVVLTLCRIRPTPWASLERSRTTTPSRVTGEQRRPLRVECSAMR